MDQLSTEAAQTMHVDVKTVEVGLKVLWDRVRRASEVIAQLREEKVSLIAKAEQLQTEISMLQGEIARRDELVKTLTASQSAPGQALVANGEREVIALRVKELLAKLNSYL